MKNKHYKHLFIVCIALISALSPLRGQKITDVSSLVAFSDKKVKELNEQRKAAEVFAEKNKLPLTYRDHNGSLQELQCINGDGIPMYYISDNAEAAKTISTSEVQSGGRSSLLLDGTGILLRTWDAGAVRLTHQEFNGRVTIGDSDTNYNYHATHVAGTMIASGINSEAKGMAYNATLKSFGWNFDVAEMALEAANGALISNHSYGYGRGWVNNGYEWIWYGNSEISTEEDYLFGFYDNQAKEWDEVAYQAPYYLIVKSAGNDRNEGPGNTHPSDGPFDCIAHAAVAKNVLTVGAVHNILNGYTGPQDVLITDFSSFGPTDDGRIKPDIVTQGMSVFSTDDDSDDDYKVMCGTSAAAPSASGSLALLQQHWANLNDGNYMLAATLKGLVIHTADEAGIFDGPDYKHGWGLMNTEKAALLISEDQNSNIIEELVLNEGEIYTRTIKSKGNLPIKVTICWTDVAGTPVDPQIDPTNLMLVNDLDVKVIHNDEIHYPWSLDPRQPEEAATKNMKNYVDNVEVININNPEAGEYTIIINHDGSLFNQQQNFSIIISGVDRNPPVVDFQANKTEISIGEEVEFECKSNGIPTSWEWTFPGGYPDFSYERNPVIRYDKAGTYEVILTTYNEFGEDTKVVENYINVKENEYPIETELTIHTFPNPAINTLHIDISDDREPTHVIIVGLLGNICNEFEITEANQPIDISHFPTGMYYAVATKNGKRSTSKFLKN
jgi:PKD repeat protein